MAVSIGSLLLPYAGEEMTFSFVVVIVVFDGGDVYLQGSI